MQQVIEACRRVTGHAIPVQLGPRRQGDPPELVADSRLEGGALNGSQQQFYVRNSDLGKGWSNYVWNQVFSGVVGAPPQNFPPNPSGNNNPYTTLPQSPVTREKPFLYVDGAGKYSVFVPALQRNSSGITW